MLIETKERKMSMANVSMWGRMITKTHLRRSKLLFKLSWTPLVFSHPLLKDLVDCQIHNPEPEPGQDNPEQKH